MKGIFCIFGNNEDYTTNEAYKKIVMKRIFIAGLFMVLGLATLVADLVAQYQFDIEMNDFMKGFFLGLGVGLFLGGGVILIKQIITLKSEEKLKKARIEESDERNRNITDKAIRTATFVLIVAMYIAMIVAGFIMPEMIKVLGILLCVFLLAYIVSYKVLQRKM